MIPEPLVVNFLAGPGAGKSTMAAAVFSELKLAGMNAELVTEFAKDITWEGNSGALQCQPYITGTQIWRVERAVLGGAKVIVTDSPVILGAAYVRPEDPMYEVCLREHYKHANMNFLVARTKKYSQVGRSHTEEQARELDGKIRDILSSNWIDHTELVCDRTGIKKAALMVIDKVNKIRS